MLMNAESSANVGLGTGVLALGNKTPTKKKLVYGKGLYEKGEYVSHFMRDGKRVHTLEYLTWYNLLRRCYSPKSLVRYPTYLGCEVSDDFLVFQNFAQWMNVQIDKGYYHQSWELDKDLLADGMRGKFYSEDTCVFLPNTINLTLKVGKGVRIRQCESMRSLRYKVESYTASKRTAQYFKSLPEAYEWYVMKKEEYIRQLAQEYKEMLDPRAYDKLLTLSLPSLYDTYTKQDVIDMHVGTRWEDEGLIVADSLFS